jgi:hypothetical protein
MSEHGAAPAPAAAPAGKAEDPLKVLGEKIFVQLAGNIYCNFGPEKRPDPKAIAKFSLKLAQAYFDGYFEVNQAAMEEAAKASKFTAADLDLASIDVKK